MMDTQPLLRVNTVKPQSSQAAPAPARDNDGANFDQQLQDQMQQAETAEASVKKDVSSEALAETPAAEPVNHEPDEAEVADEVTAEHVFAEAADGTMELSVDAELTSSLIIAVDAAQQVLPQDGNALPLLFADLIPVPGMQVDTRELPEAIAELINGRTVNGYESKADKFIMPANLPELTSKSPESTMSQTLVIDETMQAALSSEDLPLPELKLQLKAADMLSDKQIAALVNDFNKTAAVSMQQVQAITGTAAANIHTYVPPQFDALQPIASGFNGSINTPVNHPAWSQHLGQQLAFMIQGNIHSAEIKLNPAHLGPMEIHVSLKDDQASVTFVSAHAPVREALDAAMPRLRDMLEQQGLNLANVDVSAHSGGERPAPERQANQMNAPVFGEEDNQNTAPATMVTSRIDTGLSVFV